MPFAGQRLPAPRGCGRWLRWLAVAGCAAWLSGCAGLLGGVISSAPNRWIPWGAVASRTHPAVRRVLGIDQEFRVEVGQPEERLSLAVCVVEPSEDHPVPRGTILVLHGVLANSRFMLPHARRLARNGYRAVLVDSRGHGRSEGAFMTYGVLESDDLIQVIDELQHRHLIAGRLGVFGVSYGAATAIQLAGKDPRVEAVVAVAPFSSLRDVVPDFGRTILPGVGSLVPDATLDEAVTRAGVQGHFDPDQADACVAIRNTQARVLVIHGRDDWLVPTYHGRRLHDAAPDHSELVVLPWTGHLSAWIDPLQVVSRHTSAWFEEHLAGSRLAEAGATLDPE